MRLLFALSLVALVTPAVAAERRVTLLFTGDNRAEVAPCGCRNKPTGGLARRKAAVDAQKTNAVVFDAGNALFKTTAAATDDDKKRASFVMRAMGKAGTKVMVVGERDLSAGLDFLQSEAKAVGITLLSANVTLADKRVFDGAKILTVGGVKVALIGVSGGALGVLKASSPQEAVRAQLATLGPRDVTVVVAAISRLETVELAERLSGQVDAVVQSSDAMGFDQPAQKLQSGAYVIGAGQLGEGFGRLTFSLDGTGPFVDQNDMTTDRAYALYLDQQVGQLEDRIAETKDAPGRKEALKELTALKARRDEYKKALPAAAPRGSRSFTFDWLMLGADVKDDPALKAEALTFEPSYTGNH